MYYVCYLLLTSSYAKDVKIYDRNYKYAGKIDDRTGNIYDKNYKRIGKVDLSTGKVYDKNYNRVGSSRR